MQAIGYREAADDIMFVYRVCTEIRGIGLRILIATRLHPSINTFSRSDRQ